MIALIILAVIALIGLIPIGVNVTYDECGGTVRLIAGYIRLTVFPKKPKDNQQGETAKKSGSTTSTPSKGGSYKDFIPLLHLVLDLLVDMRHKIRVNHLRFKLLLAGDDPCDLAVNYGRAWAALGNLMPQLERVFHIKKRELEVECDFTADSIAVLFGADITITVARLLWLGARHGYKILKEYLRVMNKRKGGASV